MNLKPQDVVIAIKVLISGWPHTYADLARSLKMSASEAHAGVRRATAAGLLHAVPEISANRLAIREFLVHGLKYAFPAVRGPMTRGIPTSYAAPPLNRDIAAGNEHPPVWPDPNGDIRGYELKPLYRSIPKVVKEDSELYEWLSLVDAIRSGRARERKLASEILERRLRAA